MLTEEDRLKKGHIALMKHPETALWSGVLMMGENSVVDENITAYTDGVNKRYGREFLKKVCKTQEELNGLILHENLHVALRQLLHNRDLFKEDMKLANMAADYVVNDMIVNLKDKTLARLPDGGLFDPRFHNMNMREVYRALKEDQDKQGGSGEKGDGSPSNSGEGEYSFDEHDVSKAMEGMTPEEMKALDNRIDRAIREGALLAGRLGIDLPRNVTEILEPKVDWRSALAEFVASTTKGKDEMTWRKFNRRMLPNDIYLPSPENETIGELVLAIDTSGSIGQEQINEFATEIVSICESVTPDRVRILWWDTLVHGEQVFEQGHYNEISTALKPLGGGGTKVSCVSEYINKHRINAECVLVFTDGYVESDIKWNLSAPTLWLVTHNKSWTPPAGKKVFVE